jgi:hypothetical protein
MRLRTTAKEVGVFQALAILRWHFKPKEWMGGGW